MTNVKDCVWHNVFVRAGLWEKVIGINAEEPWIVHTCL